MQIRLLNVAEEDLTEIISFIDAENPKAAQSTLDKIEKSLESLSENPLLGRVPRDEDIKVLGYRYLIKNREKFELLHKNERLLVFVIRIIFIII